MTSITYPRTWMGMKRGRAGCITERRTAVVLLKEGWGLAPHNLLGMDLGGSRQIWAIKKSVSEGTVWEDARCLYFVLSIILYTTHFHLTFVVLRFAEGANHLLVSSVPSFPPRPPRATD